MQNSILFDFYSLVDRELSVIKILAGEFRETALLNFDKHAVLYTSNLDWKRARTQNKRDVFKSVITSDELKSNSDTLLESLWNEYEELILNKYAFKTSVNRLISGYNRIANGTVIKMAVYCENKIQSDFVTKEFPYVSIETGKREDVDLRKYNRIVVGNYRHALKYRYPSPKSIVILDFKENYSTNDFTLLNPELIIKLGDIHEIEVMNAYTEDE